MGRKKENSKVRNNNIENRQTVKKINKAKCQFFENINESINP